MLEDIEEKHKFILSLLPVGHIVVELVNGCLKLFIFLKYLSSFIRLSLQLAAVSIKEQIKLRSICSGSHLILIHYTGSLLLVKNLLFQLLNTIISLIYLLRHLLNMSSCFTLVTLKVLNLFVRLLNLLVFLHYDLVCVGVLGVRLLNLVLFGENKSRDTLMYLT